MLFSQAAAYTQEADILQVLWVVAAYSPETGSLRAPVVVAAYTPEACILQAGVLRAPGIVAVESPEADSLWAPGVVAVESPEAVFPQVGVLQVSGVAAWVDDSVISPLPVMKAAWAQGFAPEVVTPPVYRKTCKITPRRRSYFHNKNKTSNFSLVFILY